MDTIEEQPQPPAAVSPVELGTRIGQAQAFGLIARRCSAAGAECLKRIKDDRSYESLGLTWDQFCSQHAGISRSYADKLIQRLNEFGEPYFQLSGLAQISPDAYRRLAPAVTEQGIEVDGETIPLTPENAPRIRHAIQTLRADLRRAQQSAPNSSITELRVRLDGCFEQMSRLAGDPDAGTQAALRGLVAYSLNKLKHLAPA